MSTHSTLEYSQLPSGQSLYSYEYSQYPGVLTVTLGAIFVLLRALDLGDAEDARRRLVRTPSTLCEYSEYPYEYSEYHLGDAEEARRRLEDRGLDAVDRRARHRLRLYTVSARSTPVSTHPTEYPDRV